MSHVLEIFGIEGEKNVKTNRFNYNFNRYNIYI